MERLVQFYGKGGSITVYADRVFIEWNRLPFMKTPKDKAYPYESIDSVVFKKPKLLSDGYIQFIESGSVSKPHKDSASAQKDPDTMLILRETKEEAEVVYNLILQKLVEHKRGLGSVISRADELEKFAALKAKGIISEEEFEAKKKQILE